MSKKAGDHDLSFDEFDELRKPGPEITDFDRVVDVAISRRGFLGGTLAYGSTALLAGASSMSADPAKAAGRMVWSLMPISP